MLLLLVSACATAPSRPEVVVDPAREVAERFASAVARADGAEVARLLARDRRRDLDEASLTRALAAIPEPQRKVDLSRPGPEEIAFGGALPLTFVREGAGYRLLSGVPRFDRRDTPEEAFRTFARAFRAKDDALLAQFVPAPRRAEVTAPRLRDRLSEPTFVNETKSILDRLEADGRPEAVGADRWRIRAGTHAAELLREPSGWVLATLE